MAVPIDPESGLFPDSFVAPFVVAPEVEELAQLVIASCDEFANLEAALAESQVSIVYVFETKPFDPLKEEYKPHTIAKVTKAAPLWRALTNYDLAIQFRQAFWDAFDDRQRQAVLHHELTHIDIDEPDDQGPVKFSLRPHDVEDFSKTIRRFGAIIPGRAAFFKAFLDWQHEQERPEPTKLRRVVTGGATDPMDDVDVRPTGEVNVDELRGAVDRDVPNDEAPA